MALKLDPITGELVELEDVEGTPAPQVQQPPPPSSINPQVADYLKQKYNLGEFSNENRQKLVDSQDVGMGDRVSAMLAAAGAGFLNKDPFAAGQSVLKSAKADKRQKIEDFDKARDQKMQEFAFDRDLTKAQREDRDDEANQRKIAEMRDPNSERSKAAQQSLIDDYGMDPAVAAKLTAEQAEARIPGIKQKIDREMRERELRLKEQEARSKRKDSKAKGNVSPVSGEPLTDAQKQVDKDYAKQYNEFSAQGASNARITIEQLKKFKKELEEESKKTFEDGGGRIGSMLPDVMRTDQSLVWKRDIPSKANSVLKKLFGGAMSEKDREAESATYYDDMLGPAENAKKLAEKIKQLEMGYENESRKAKYYEKYGTLDGFVAEAGDSEQAPKDETKTINGKTYRKVPGGWEEI